MISRQSWENQHQLPLHNLLPSKLVQRWKSLSLIDTKWLKPPPSPHGRQPPKLKSKPKKHLRVSVHQWIVLSLLTLLELQPDSFLIQRDILVSHNTCFCVFVWQWKAVKDYAETGKSFPTTDEEFEKQISKNAFHKLTDADPDIYAVHIYTITRWIDTYVCNRRPERQWWTSARAALISPTTILTVSVSFSVRQLYNCAC